MRASEHEQMWYQAYPTTLAQVIAVLSMLLVAVLSVVCAPIILSWLLARRLFTAARRISKTPAEIVTGRTSLLKPRPYV